MRLHSFLILVCCVIFHLSLSDLSCKNREVRVGGKIAATSEMFAVFQRCADEYIEARRNLGIDVDIDLNHSLLKSYGDQEKNRSYLFNVPSAFTWAGNNEFTFPILSRALVMVFNIPGVSTLRMPMELIADIYKGNITTWNDPRIKQYNTNVTLPGEEIIVLARQEEVEVSTILFTFMLTKMDDEWASSRGTFKGPDFVNGSCCRSRNWKNTVKYFPVDAVGVVGMVLSVPYTIGYALRPNVEAYNMSKIVLLHNTTTWDVVSPTVKTLQAVMVDYVGNSDPNFIIANGSIAMTRMNYQADGIYPMTAISYVTLNMEHSSTNGVDCCAVRELVGFLESMIVPPNPKLFTDWWFAPVPRSMADLILRIVLKRITCDDMIMYEEYRSSKVQQATISSGIDNTTLLLITVLIALTAAGIIGAVFLCSKVKEKRTKANYFLISPDRLRMESTATGSHTPLAHKNRTDDMRSFAESRKATTTMHKETAHLKSVYNTGYLDDTASVNLAEFPLPVDAKGGDEPKVYSIDKWSEKTRTLANKLRKSSGHRNLATFLGLVEQINDRTYTVFEYFVKGTLHYNLATCRYRLTDSIKRYLAIDVANGLEYLHTRVGVVHGQLNTLTCLLDLSWTVKIALWDQAALHYCEALKAAGPGGNPFMGDNTKWNCKGDDVKTILQGAGASESLIRLVYLDPRFQSLYPHYAVDVYSFGMLVVEIFTGKIPYEEEMNDQVALQCGSVTPDPMKRRFDAYAALLTNKFNDAACVRLPMFEKAPKHAQNIVEACLRADPTKRPTIKTILRHLSLSTTDVNKGGLVDAMMETMDTYAEQLEEKVEERTAELKQVTARMRDLLNEVLPPQIAEKLFQGVAVPPEHFDCVTVYFSDIVGFTIISARSTPIQVMNFLNDLWLKFDAIIQDFDVYKVDTIGDAYMVCSGLPNRNGYEHCREIGRMAITLLKACKKFQIAHLPDEKLHIRIGLNTGPVTAGVVGLKMPQYCVFGDTVNTAARMESTSLPGRIQISSTTYLMLVDHFPGEFAYEYRGEINVKGKGNMLTYWLLSTDDAKSRTSAASIF